jgi:hypothetical protein
MSRRSVTALGAAAAVFGVLGLVFGVFVKPVDDRGCTSDLFAGTYRDLFAPVHLAAYLALCWLILWTRPPGRTVRIVLGVTTALVVLGPLYDAQLMVAGVLGLILCVPAGFAGLIVLGVRRDDAAARLALWIALLVLLPAAYMGAYLQGSGTFCF